MARSPDISIHGGEIRAWLEQDTSIHIKAVDGHGDPVELTSQEARRLANGLLELAQRLDDLDSGRS